MQNTVEQNPASLLQQIRVENFADRKLVDALIRYRAVAEIMDPPGASWALLQIKLIETSSHQMEVSRLVSEVEQYTAACQEIGYDGGFERGTAMRKALTDPAFYKV
jgi:hypothetical protein